MTDKTDTPDDPFWRDAPYTAEEVAEKSWIGGCAGIGRNTWLTSWWVSWLSTHGDEATDCWIDPAGEATDLPDDLSRTNPLDGEPSDDEPPAGGDA